MSNNTRRSQTSGSTAFLLTLNQVEKFEDLKKYVLALRHLRYAIAGLEVAPSTGHQHIHIFLQFVISTRLSLNGIQHAHVDKCRGTPVQNKNYVSKDGNIIWEYGEMKGKGFLSIEEVKTLTQRERDKLPFQYYNLVEKMNNLENLQLFTANTNKHVKVYYISGSSGIGKTNFARFLIGAEAYNIVKYENGFWLGASSVTRIALYDDWRDNHMKASEFLNFIDYNKQIMNIKGGYVINNYEIIILTSIFRLRDIYTKVQGESRLQWERRVREIYLSVVSNDDRRKWINFLFIKLKYYIKLYIFKQLKNNI